MVEVGAQNSAEQNAFLVFWCLTGSMLGVCHHRCNGPNGNALPQRCCVTVELHSKQQGAGAQHRVASPRRMLRSEASPQVVPFGGGSCQYMAEGELYCGQKYIEGGDTRVWGRLRGGCRGGRGVMSSVASKFSQAQVSHGQGESRAWA
jgi:hypothetical protein